MLPKEICVELARRLTTARLQKAWARETLAHRANVNVHTLKHFERTGQISLERLIALCQALDIHHDIERLFKPRQRLDSQQWQLISEPMRKRGKRNSFAEA